VEGHRRDLEEQAGEEEEDSEDEQVRTLGSRHQLRERRQPEVSREAINERQAVEQDPGGEGAEDEVFQCGFGRLRLALEVPGEDVGSESHGLERDVDRDQVVPGDHEEHSDAGEEKERVVLPSRIGRRPDERHRREDREHEREQDRELEEEGEVVHDEHAREDRPDMALRRGGHEGGQRAGQDDEEDGEIGEEVLLGLAERGREPEHEQARAGQEELRRQEEPVCGLEGHGAVPAGGCDFASDPAGVATPASAGAVIVLPPTAVTIFSDGRRRTSKIGLG
jgi:hypothetical protein